MYAWIWHKLPFGFWGRVSGSVALAAVAAALLWFVIFPWATPMLPFDDVQVGTEQGGPAAPGVTGDEGPDDIPYSTESNAPHPSDTPGN